MIKRNLQYISLRFETQIITNLRARSSIVFFITIIHRLKLVLNDNVSLLTYLHMKKWLFLLIFKNNLDYKNNW